MRLSPGPSFPQRSRVGREGGSGTGGGRDGGNSRVDSSAATGGGGRPALGSGEASCLSPGCDDRGPPWGPGFDLDHQDWRGPCGEPRGRLTPSPQVTPQKSVLNMEPRALHASADRREGGQGRCRAGRQSEGRWVAAEAQLTLWRWFQPPCTHRPCPRRQQPGARPREFTLRRSRKQPLTPRGRPLSAGEVSSPDSSQACLDPVCVLGPRCRSPASR